MDIVDSAVLKEDVSEL